MPALADLLERLLFASGELSPDADFARVAETFVPIAADALPHVAIGVRVLQRDDSPVIVRCSPRNLDLEAHDPVRLFPSFEHERIIPLLAEEGSTLHLAADDGALVFPDVPHERFLERFVMTIAAALRHARAHVMLLQMSKQASFGQLAAEIVHELNNPLTSIVAYSDYLHKKALRSGAESADTERLGRIYEAAERMRTYVRDLLAYARPGKTEPTVVAIHDVIEQALGFCDHVFRECHVTIERSFGEVPAIHGVPGQLTQVFVNLFTNAAHAMRERGGCLSIQTSVVAEGTHVRVNVEDEGHGLASSHLERIFEPYFTTKPVGMGTGLGLSIVRNIVTAHGGRIRAYVRPNRGAGFEVELPGAVRPHEPI